MDGYKIVADKVREYWKKNGVSDVVVLLRTDNYPHEVIAQCLSDSDYESVTFDYDFWEGEQNIEVEIIEPLWKVLLEYRDRKEKHDYTS